MPTVLQNQWKGKTLPHNPYHVAQYSKVNKMGDTLMKKEPALLREFSWIHFFRCSKRMPREDGWTNIRNQLLGDKIDENKETLTRLSDLARINRIVVCTSML